MLDSEILIPSLIGVVTTITSGWAGWFFTKKKYNSEVDLNIMEKMQRSLDFYTKLSDDNTRVLEETLHKLDASEKRNDKLENEVREMKNQMLTFMTQVCTDLTCSLRKSFVGNLSERHSDYT